LVNTFIPDSLQEALKIKDSYNDAVILAGGTDLMVKQRSGQGLLPGFTKPVLFIGQLESLQHIEKVKKTLYIGAACRLSDLLEHPDVPEIVKEAVCLMASPAVRNTGTLGGNICNASPAGDTLPPLYVLEASVLVKSLTHSREVSIRNFITGPGKVDLRANELLISIKIPLEEYNIFFYKKVGARKADAISKLSFAGLARTSGQIIEDVRIALGAVAPRVVRAKEIERLVIGKSITETRALFPQLSNYYSSLIQPIDDQRSNAKYRKTVALHLLEYFLTECIRTKTT
jgi:xanthine dehydrogenase FAD-binding subunit